MNENHTYIDGSRPLSEFCRNATNIEGDTFVGVKSDYIDGNYNLSVVFPLGYNISKKEDVVRNEIIQLISILQEYGDEQSRIKKNMPEQLLKTFGFPIQAYYIVLIEYLTSGYYRTNEEQFKSGVSGSVNWNRTIKQERPIAQENGFVYTQYRIRQYNETDKDLITEINKVCVFQSCLRLGWLYKISLPPRPVTRRTDEVYKSYLTSVFLRTNRDKDKRLIQAMIDILNYENNEDDPDHFYFGTNNFEYIWEKLIESTYGNENKEEYFPKTKWLLREDVNRTNSALEPDTVMRENNSIYVLDAKYYKYGATANPKDLPNSSSINKQISYGEHIVTNNKFSAEIKKGMQVYNAFLMPYNSEIHEDNAEYQYYSIGEAIAEWKDSSEPYQRVQGILIDVKLLMSNKIKPNSIEIFKLSKVVRESLKQNKNSF